MLVAGGTSTGKTTLVNALLAEVARSGDRVVLIEDTRELQCAAPNLVALRTKDGVAITCRNWSARPLRLRPDRIPIGEVRGAEALDLLKAWGTGHPGGVGTIHAGSALGALRRLEQLIQEAVVTVPRALIAETIDLVAVLAGRGGERRLAELAVRHRPFAGRRLPLYPNWRTLMMLLRPIALLSVTASRPLRLRRSRYSPPRRLTPPAQTCRGSSHSTKSCSRSKGPVAKDPRGNRHHRHWPDACVRRYVWAASDG